MLDVLARHWWAFAIRGAAAIIFGGLALLWPGTTFFALTIFFGAYAFVDGIFAITSAFVRLTQHESAAWLFAEGVIGILIGILAFVFTDVAALTLLYLIAVWAIFTGALEIGAAVELRRIIAHEWLLIVSGIASIIMGALLFVFPLAGIIAVTLIVGFYAIIFGALEIGLAVRLYSIHRHAGDSALLYPPQMRHA